MTKHLGTLELYVRNLKRNSNPSTYRVIRYSVLALEYSVQRKISITRDTLCPKITSLRIPFQASQHLLLSSNRLLETRSSGNVSTSMLFTGDGTLNALVDVESTQSSNDQSWNSQNVHSAPRSSRIPEQPNQTRGYGASSSQRSCNCRLFRFIYLTMVSPVYSHDCFHKVLSVRGCAAPERPIHNHQQAISNTYSRRSGSRTESCRSSRPNVLE